MSGRARTARRALMRVLPQPRHRCPRLRQYAVAVRIELDEESVCVRLSPWQKALGLLGDIRVARGDIAGAGVVTDPVARAMAAGTKVGLRLPWLYYVARTIRLDEAFVVRRGVPALCVEIENEGSLRRVLVSTPEAGALAERLQPSRRPAPR